jgi:predicted phage terminase large subunit-like protein
MEAFVRVVDAGSFSGAAKQLRLGQPAVSKTIAQLEEHLNRKEIFYILEVVRGRFPFGTLKQKVMEVKRRYGSSTLLIEDSPISRGLIQSLREQSINVTIYKPDTDKRARVIAQTDLFAGGSVRFPRRAEWLEECIAEILAFPGRHDDQVDALTQGLAWGRQRNLVPRVVLGGY